MITLFHHNDGGLATQFVFLVATLIWKMRYCLALLLCAKNEKYFEVKLKILIAIITLAQLQYSSLSEIVGEVADWKVWRRLENLSLRKIYTRETVWPRWGLQLWSC